MGLFDRILGPDVGPGLFSSEGRPEPLSRAEAEVAAALKTARVVESTTLPATNASDSGPFAEVVVPFVEMRSPLVNPGGAAPFGASPIGEALTFNIPGERLLLKRSGTPPDTRLLVLVGGKLRLFTPGQEVVASFTSFTIVKRLHWIPGDVFTTFSNLSAEAFQGEAQFVVSKLQGASYNEPDEYLGTPWFRPVDLANGAPGAMPPGASFGALRTTGSSFLVVRAGCRRLRFIYSSVNPQGGGAGTIAAADVVEVRVHEKPMAYDVEGSLPNAAGLTDGVFRKVYADALTLTWGSQQAYAVELEVAPGCSDILQAAPVITGSRTLYLSVQGVP
jgi:hypothetical protein